MNANSLSTPPQFTLAQSTPPILEARGVAKRYGAFEALTPTSLTIDAGEIVAIVGANGSGKSTLLRRLAGVAGERGSQGELLLHGESLTRESAARVRAFVPQRPEIAADFSARDVVRLGRFAGGSDEGAVTRALALVGLAARANLAVDTLSGGERQRVAVARALAQIDGAKRPLLLLDEPFSGIDPGEVARVAVALRDIARSGAVVLSLHDPGLARLLATRALVLREGRVLFDGPAREVLTTARLSEAYQHPMVESAGWLAPAMIEKGTMRSC